jgi:hypothetical protein
MGFLVQRWQDERMGRAWVAGMALACIGISAPAGAAMEHVSHSEFNRATNGMTAIAITNLFGIPGKMTYQGTGYQTRVFPGWKSGDGERYRVEVDFRIGPDSKWHVSSKSAYLPDDTCGDC